MSQFPWYAWIAIAGTLGWAISGIVYSVSRARRSAVEAELGAPQSALLAESTAATRAVVERLDRIDVRIATIEKTLTDIQ
jgi:hypothetical protein